MGHPDRAGAVAKSDMVLEFEVLQGIAVKCLSARQSSDVNEVSFDERIFDGTVCLSGTGDVTVFEDFGEGKPSLQKSLDAGGKANYLIFEYPCLRGGKHEPRVPED